MRPIEYYLTEKGEKISKDPKYLEEERKILKILSNGRKNISEVLEELQKEGFNDLNWYKVKNWLENLQKDGLVRIFN
jgi:hypothetical protein